MSIKELSQIRNRVTRLSAGSGDTAELAKAVLVLNDALQQQTAKITALEKEVESLRRSRPR